MKLVWSTDEHLSDYTPSSRKDNWTEAVLASMRQVNDICKSVESDILLRGGDLFDIKQPSRNSHSLVQKAIEVHDECPCPVFSVIGNHDVKYGNPDFIYEAPLGVLAASGKITLLPDEGVLFDNVHVVPIHYHGPKYDRSKLEQIKKHPDADYLVVACHLLASPGKDTTMFEGEDIIGYDYLDILAQQIDADIFFFGHWHADQGIQYRETSSGSNYYVVNTGSLTRGSLSKDSLTRKPCVVEVEFDEKGLLVTRHDLVVPPPDEVFDIDKKVAEDEQDRRLEEFATSLSVSLMTQTMVNVNLEELIESTGQSARVKVLANEILREAKNEKA
jgi:exonuclease SbcD